MARMMTAAFLLAAAMAPAWSQVAPDVQLKQAGVCARCHVISVVEWDISGRAAWARSHRPCWWPFWPAEARPLWLHEDSRQYVSRDGE